MKLPVEYIGYGSEKLPLFLPNHVLQQGVTDPEKTINSGLFIERLRSFLRGQDTGEAGNSSSQDAARKRQYTKTTASSLMLTRKYFQPVVSLEISTTTHLRMTCLRSKRVFPPM
ncbi:MAG: hypothetical protein ACI8ZB_005408 [Desulforhopalus sp.]|jgi:hypothetical protein